MTDGEGMILSDAVDIRRTGKWKELEPKLDLS
jgi:hypothetical protein